MHFSETSDSGDSHVNHHTPQTCLARQVRLNSPKNWLKTGKSATFSTEIDGVFMLKVAF